MRYFEKISLNQFKKDISLDDSLYNSIEIPKRATKYSAGYDFYLNEDIVIKKGEKVKIPTGLKVRLNEDEFLGIYVRSGLGTKKNIRMCNQTAIIDHDYYNNISNEGHIFVFLQNHGEEDVFLKKGSAYVQGIFQKYYLSDNDFYVCEDRVGGLGSSDKGDEINGK